VNLIQISLNIGIKNSLWVLDILQNGQSNDLFTFQSGFPICKIKTVEQAFMYRGLVTILLVYRFCPAWYLQIFALKLSKPLCLIL